MEEAVTSVRHRHPERSSQSDRDRIVIRQPGLLLGGIPGALIWRRHRIAGGLLGAIAGFVVWLTGWMWLKDMI